MFPHNPGPSTPTRNWSDKGQHGQAKSKQRSSTGQAEVKHRSESALGLARAPPGAHCDSCLGILPGCDERAEHARLSTRLVDVVPPPVSGDSAHSNLDGRLLGGALRRFGGSKNSSCRRPAPLDSGMCLAQTALPCPTANDFAYRGIRHRSQSDGYLLSQSEYIAALQPTAGAQLTGLSRTDLASQMQCSFSCCFEWLSLACCKHAIYVNALQRRAQSPTMLHLRRLTAVVRWAQRDPFEIRFRPLASSLEVQS